MATECADQLVGGFDRGEVIKLLAHYDVASIAGRRPHRVSAERGLHGLYSRTHCVFRVTEQQRPPLSESRLDSVGAR